MAQDIIARLKADTSKWDSGLSKAGRSMAQFRQQNLSMEGVLNQQVKSLMKVGAQYMSYGAAISGAMKVAKDAFMSSESGVDEWGRTMTSAGDLYKSFVSSLNNASLSSFFSNIQNIINAAREAYNALDDLQTKGGKISNREARLGARQQELMAIINDKSQSNEDRSSAQAELNELTKQMKGAKQESATLNARVVSSKIKELLVENGFKPGTEGYRQAEAEIRKSFEDTSYKMKNVNTGFQGGMRISNGKTVRYTDNGNRNLENIVTDQWRNEVNPYYQAYWQKQGEASSIERTNNRFAQKGISSLPGSSSGSSVKIEGIGKDIMSMSFGATESMKELNAQLKYYNDLLYSAKNSAEQAFAQKAIEDTKKAIEVQPIALSLGVSTESIVDIKEKMDNFFKENPIELLPTDYFTKFNVGGVIADDAKDVEKSWAGASNAISAASSALGQIEDPGAKIAGIIGQALATLASTFAMSLKGTVTPWDWIAAAISGAATLASISGVVKKSVEYHADGGVVGMNSLRRGTDTVPAMLTPGEIVLSAANQKQLASNLQSNGQAGGVYESITRAEDVVTIINTWGKRTGKGEIMFG